MTDERATLTGSGEPTGHTVDGTPWEEARPPHLPDPVTGAVARTPLPAWIFLAAAVLSGWWAFHGLDVSRATWVGWISLGSSILQAAAPGLIGAALFIRHPRAMVSDPKLVAGIGLLVVVGVWPIVRSVLPDTLLVDETGVASGFRVAWIILVEIARFVGVLLIARGLVEAREHEDTPGARGRVVVLAAATIVAIAVESLALLPVLVPPLGVDSNDPMLVAANVPVFFLNMAVLAAWAYVVAVSRAGSAAGEVPARAWRNVSAGASWVYLAGLGSVVVSALIAVTGGYGPPEPVSLAFYIPWDVAYVGVNVLLGVGYVLIIAAFARGLPGVDVVPATIDEPAPDEGAPASP